MSSRSFAPLVVVGVLVGCTGSDDSRPAPGAPAVCAPPNREIAGTCLPPGVADDGCAAGTLVDADGACRPAGISPDQCGKGFVHDGASGCAPVLPPDACARGWMASLGETACRPVMPCAPGTWGDIPVDSTTQYVDANYAGTDSDGTQARPWTAIGDAVIAATAGGLIAVAAGSYAEDVVLEGKPVVLAGVCPDQVEIVGTGAELAVVSVLDGADGTVVRGVALRGAGAGMFVSGAERVVADRLWVHDTTARGVDVERAFGDASLTVVGSLIEGVRQAGIYVSGSTAVVEGTTVRGTRAQGGIGGHGVHAQNTCTQSGCDPNARAQVTVSGCVIDQNEDVGVFAAATDIIVESTLVRGTTPASDGDGGRGISVGVTCSSDACDPATRTHATIESSVVEQNHKTGIFSNGADVLVAATVVKGTQPVPALAVTGRGIESQVACNERACDSSIQSHVVVRHALVDSNHYTGVIVQGSVLELDGVVVRQTLPASDGSFGTGVAAGVVCYAGACDWTARADATIRGSVVEECHEAGILVAGSEATIESTIVRATQPRPSDGTFGRGISFSIFCATSIGCDPTGLASGTIRSSLVEYNRDVSLFVAGADVAVESTAVRSTLARASDQTYGDGAAVFGGLGPTTLALDSTSIEDSARAGVSNFGAHVRLSRTAVRCAAFELEGEPQGDIPFSFEDGGSNACGCPPEPDGECVAVSAGLAPPAAAPDSP